MKSSEGEINLIPIDVQGESLRSTKARKLKGEEKMPQMNEKAANLQYDKSAKKLGANKVDEIMCQ